MNDPMIDHSYHSDHARELFEGLMKKWCLESITPARSALAEACQQLADVFGELHSTRADERERLAAIMAEQSDRAGGAPAEVLEKVAAWLRAGGEAP